VVAVFAGLLTKVGVYSLVRTQTLLFPGDLPVWIMLTLAGLTMIVGVLGAIAQNDMKRILSFHIVSQIGYMVFGLGLFTVVGLAATVFYVVHHIIVKTTLFLIGGLVEETTGTGQLRKVGGLLHSAPLLAVMFLVAGLSLSGIPPLSGFLAKLGLVQAGFAAGAGGVVAVSLVVSLLTLFSMTKIWSGVFWGRPEEPPPIPESMEVDRIRFPVLMMTTAGALCVISLWVAVAAGPLYALAERAADGLADPTLYIARVLEP
jgi:multicomponent Na+:H+ antiporter subunit D